MFSAELVASSDKKEVEPAVDAAVEGADKDGVSISIIDKASPDPPCACAQCH